MATVFRLASTNADQPTQVKTACSSTQTFVKAHLEHRIEVGNKSQEHVRTHFWATASSAARLCCRFAAEAAWSTRFLACTKGSLWSRIPHALNNWTWKNNITGEVAPVAKPPLPELFVPPIAAKPELRQGLQPALDSPLRKNTAKISCWDIPVPVTSHPVNKIGFHMNTGNI